MNKIDFERRQSEAKPFHDRYDEILRKLNMDCRTHTDILSNVVDIAYLTAKGLISTGPYIKDIDTYRIILTHKGCVFRTEGGFKEQDRIELERNEEIERSADLARHSKRNSNISLWVSIGVAALTLIALVYTIFKPEKPPVVKVIVVKEKLKLIK